MNETSHHSAAADLEHVASVGDPEAARAALRHGPRGALVVAASMVTMLLAGWLAVYLLLFLPRGAVH